MGPLEVFSRTSRWLRGQRPAQGPCLQRRDHRAQARRLPDLFGASSPCRTAILRSGARSRHAAHRRRAGDRSLPAAPAASGLDTPAGPVGETAGVDLHRGLPSRRSRPAQGPARHHALGFCARLGARISERPAGARCDLRARRKAHHLGRRHRRHDLALALVDEDHGGREVALRVARELVMFLRRPGGQSQFQRPAGRCSSPSASRCANLQAHILENPGADLSVETLARRAAMSPRNFARVFTREVGTTPARFVISSRIDAARRLLEDTSDSLEEICRRCGPRKHRNDAARLPERRRSPACPLSGTIHEEGPMKELLLRAMTGRRRCRLPVRHRFGGTNIRPGRGAGEVGAASDGGRKPAGAPAEKPRPVHLHALLDDVRRQGVRSRPAPARSAGRNWWRKEEVSTEAPSPGKRRPADLQRRRDHRLHRPLRSLRQRRLRGLHGRRDPGAGDHRDGDDGGAEIHLRRCSAGPISSCPRRRRARSARQRGDPEVGGGRDGAHDPYAFGLQRRIHSGGRRPSRRSRRHDHRPA